jgi:rSAM/selenodomain-associated transferase 2
MISMNNLDPEKARPLALSVVVPVLNEALELPQLCEDLHKQIANTVHSVEVIFVDGGSVDGSPELIMTQGFRCVSSECGRARQMNAGAVAATGQAILFLHADSELPINGIDAVLAALDEKLWGRFDVRISGKAKMFAVIAFFINWRSRLSGIATGDQGIFVRRDAFEKVGGFPDQALMEDIAMSAMLRKISAPVCLCLKMTTSGRRWERRGIWSTILLMWRLRLLYWLGVSPQSLARRYE